MNDENELIEPGGGSLPELPGEPAPPIDSRFLFVDVAALRAKQLRRGARPRVGEADVARVSHKAERVAMEEVRRGLVYYNVTDGRTGRTDAGGATGAGRTSSGDEA